MSPSSSHARFSRSFCQDGLTLPHFRVQLGNLSRAGPLCLRVQLLFPADSQVASCRVTVRVLNVALDVSSIRLLPACRRGTSGVIDFRYFHASSSSCDQSQSNVLGFRRLCRVPSELFAMLLELRHY